MYSLCPLCTFPNPSAIIFLSSLSSNPSGSVFKAHSCLRAFTLLVLPAGYALPSNVPISISGNQFRCLLHRGEPHWRLPSLTITFLYLKFYVFVSVQFSSVAQSCPTLCDPMDRSTPVLPVHHQLTEFTQTHVHWVGDAIQPSHPLSSPSPALNLSQHQSLFKWVSSSHQVAKVLEFQLQHQSFQWIFGTDLL